VNSFMFTSKVTGVLLVLNTFGWIFGFVSTFFFIWLNICLIGCYLCWSGLYIDLIELIGWIWTETRKKKL